ncbi:DUF11 domain-containing protein [Deinococcus sp. Arct2-2]|uniref:prealbumin-like fold domain-containing protein n=1 Tax=Deinococcus sp. Arct2-2 TaxID=2568653 RepID=UPI0010A36673|nr:DUF11 domain-containing protein [Deinococcus sp. Arct2-2]THF68466.1 DUF11 domain-containing protein [Deinococcus sp. Arct2-2]
MGVSTITFTLTNSNSNTALSNLNFTDTLSGMSVSSTAIGGTCSGVTNSPALAVNATALNLTIPTLAASASCTVTVQVKGTRVGTNPNITTGVTSTETPVAGAASNTANLLVTPLALGVSKAFSPASVVAGATTTLTITVTNPNGVAVTAFALKDDIRTTTTITGLTITSVTTDTCKGAATPTTTNGSYVLSGGTLPTGGCSIVMNVQVPASAATVAATNTIYSADVSGTVNGITTTATTNATASLSVTALPTLTIIKISSGGVGTFNFMGDNGFGSDSITTTTAGVGGTGATKTLTAINTATTVTETVVASYTTTVNCIDSNSGSTGNTLPVTSATNAITIPAVNVKAGAVYTCTYTKQATAVAPAITLTKLGRNVKPGAVFTDSSQIDATPQHASINVNPGDTVEYCIVYRNAGGNAPNFVLKDYVPVGMQIVADAYSTGRGVRWASGSTLAVGSGAAPAGQDLTNADNILIDPAALDSTPVTNPADPADVNGVRPLHPGLLTFNLGVAGVPATGTAGNNGTVCFQARVP